MSRAARALIDCDALQHNLEQVRIAAPGSRVLAVIKANGYGHGIVPVARALAGADAFGVACVEEAAELREAGIDAPLVLLEGVFDAGELAYAAGHDLQIVVHSAEQLVLLEAASPARPLTVWLKVDSGMHRLGFAPEHVAGAWARLQACPAVARGVRLMTHLARADRRDTAAIHPQLDVFAEAVSELEGERSIANSGAILACPASHQQWVRPGIMLYGASPFVDGDPFADNLRPAMTLTTRLIAVNRFRRGDAVGYGGAWTCPEDMPVGVAAIGYGDGYPRHAETGTPVLVNARRVPLIGRVSMDMICLDLRGQPEAKAGDPVVLWGDGLPVDEIARHAGTIPYELLCRVTPRVHFAEQGPR